MIIGLFDKNKKIFKKNYLAEPFDICPHSPIHVNSRNLLADFVIDWRIRAPRVSLGETTIVKKKTQKEANLNTFGTNQRPIQRAL